MSNVPQPPPPPPPGGPAGPPPGAPGSGPAPYPGQAPPAYGGYGGYPPGAPGGYPPGAYGGYGDSLDGVAGRPFASFGARLGSWLLDGLLYGLLLVPIFVGAFFLGARQLTCYEDYSGEIYRCEVSGSGSLIALAIILAIAGNIFVAFLYVRGMAKQGQTWGCKITGLRIVTANGDAPGWGKALGRSLFASFISGNIFFIGYLWMLWDDRKQTLHDKVVDTYVVSE